jgi:hypothetical protein
LPQVNGNNGGFILGADFLKWGIYYVKYVRLGRRRT